MKFRHHREMLDDSMATMVELPPTREALAAHLTEAYGYAVSASAIAVSWYAVDKRIDWPVTYIVAVNNDAVGFTDGPVT